MGLSTADHSVSPPRIEVPREYNAAHDLIERNLAAGRGPKIAYIDDAGEYTYAQLAERVNRFASGLTALGLDLEQRVVLAMLDTIDWPVAFLGAIKAGIVPVAVNTLLTTKDYEFMLSDSRARALVLSDRRRACSRMRTGAMAYPARRRTDQVRGRSSRLARRPARPAQRRLVDRRRLAIARR